MLTLIRSATHWVGRHSLPAAAATVLVLGAAGGGIGYSIASHTTAAPLSSSAPSASQPPATAKAHSGTAASRSQALITKALGLLSKAIGQPVASIRAQLAAGKSINDIAGSKASAVEAQILAEITKIGDRAVKAGKINATQESTYLALAKTKVAALMAEPGMKLMQDVQKFLQFLQTQRHTATASPASGT
jgi:hypothetical protein